MKNWRWFSMLLGLCFTAVAPGQTNSSPLELHVKKVLYLHLTQSPVVILVDKSEKQFLPIWIGFSEAQAIALEMEQFKPPRPMTHDLFPKVVKELGGKIEKVVITETKANTYYATLTVSTRDKTKEIDCRPSDGIAIALRVQAPIYASASVMANARPVPADVDDDPGAQRLHQLSLTLQTLTADLAEALGLTSKKGVLVSSSEHPQIARGDVIVSVDGRPVQNAAELVRELAKATPGGQVEFRLIRNSKTETVRVPLDKPARPGD